VRLYPLYKSGPNESLRRAFNTVFGDLGYPPQLRCLEAIHQSTAWQVCWAEKGRKDTKQRKECVCIFCGLLPQCGCQVDGTLLTSSRARLSLTAQRCSTAKECHFTSNSAQLCLMVITLVPPFPPDPSRQTFMTSAQFQVPDGFLLFLLDPSTL
jgi:hypothetical protein